MLSEVYAKRFWAKVNKDGPISDFAPNLGKCWIWTAASSNGYGRLTMNNKQLSAHRVSYCWLVGPLKSGMEIDHLCKVTKCVNPRHLELVTTKTNCYRSNSLPSRNAKKTHCPKGHPYVEENIYWQRGPYGLGRVCKICAANRLKVLNQKNAEKRLKRLSQ